MVVRSALVWVDVVIQYLRIALVSGGNIGGENLCRQGRLKAIFVRISDV